MIPIKDVFIESLRTSLNGLIQGASEDILKYTEVIANEMTQAAATNDTAKLDELLAQIQLIGELNRIRAVNVQWDVIQNVISGLVQMGTKALIGGLVI